MQYRLRTLVFATAIGPPLIASIYWVAKWIGANPIALTVVASLALLAAWIIGPIGCYRELMRMVCGPECFRPMPRKTRRRVRFRIERYAGGST